MFKKWFENAKKILNDIAAKRTLKTLLIWGGISILAVFITFNWFIEFATFAIAGLAIVGAIGAFWVFDRFILSEIDTIEELKKGNTAYAIFLLSIAIMVAAAISAIL